MTSTRLLSVATLIGLLAAAPALAQDGRGRPRNPGTAREWSGGGGPSPRGGHDGGPPAGHTQAQPDRSPDRGRVDASGYEGGRRHAVPRESARDPEAVRPVAPSAPAFRDNDRRRDDRRYQAPRGDVRRHDDRGRYSRPDAVGRGVPRPYGYVGPRYNSPRYSPPRYVAPGYRGGWSGRSWGYYDARRGWYDPYRRGWYGTRVYVTPRFISPRIVTVLPYERYYYRPSLGLGLFYGAGGLAPFGVIPQTYYNPSSGYGLGGVRITDAPRDAQVFVDGYYAGIVDDFDGVFQHINLEGGEHRIEIHHPGFQAVAFDVFVQPGRTITLRADLY